MDHTNCLQVAIKTLLQQNKNLIYEPSEAALLEELKDIKHTMSQDTPLSWLIETLTEC